MIDIPASHIDENRRLSLGLIMTENGDLTPWCREHLPQSFGMAQICPHIVPWPLQDDPPVEWLRENVAGCWLQWARGLHFTDPRDAFAFKMRWL